MDRMSAELLPARADPLQAVPAAAPGEACHRSCGRATEVLRGARGLSRRQSVRSVPGSPAPDQVVRLCQAAFAGPEAVLAYLARYTHRVAISNSRLIRADDSSVTFTWKDYRVEGRARCKAMTLASDEFIRRFLLHVLPRGFHRIRHYGLFANGSRATNLTRARALLGAREPPCETATAGPAGATAPPSLTQPCPCCGGRMLIIERFARGSSPVHRPSAPTAVIRIDTS